MSVTKIQVYLDMSYFMTCSCVGLKTWFYCWSTVWKYCRSYPYRCFLCEYM